LTTNTGSEFCSICDIFTDEEVSGVTFVHPLHEFYVFIIITESLEGIFVLIREREATPDGESFATNSGFEVISGEFVDVFEVVFLQRLAPRLVKRICEAPAA